MWKLQSERGASLVIAGLFVPLLVGMVGCAIDVGNLYFSQSRLQNAADAAALAGVGYKSSTTTRLIAPDNLTTSSFDYTIDGNVYNFQVDTEGDEEREAAAKAYVTNNTRNTSKTEIYKLWKDTRTNMLAYQVTLQEPVDTAFMHVFGLDSLNAYATATAIGFTAPEEIPEKIPTFIAQVMPNYTWETVTRDTSPGQLGNQYYSGYAGNTGYKSFKVQDSQKGELTYEYKNSVNYFQGMVYFTTSTQMYKSFSETVSVQPDSYEGRLIASYTDNDITAQNRLPDGTTVPDSVLDTAVASVADPILESNKNTYKGNFRKQVWTLDNEHFVAGIKKINSDFDDLQAFYVDRPTIGADNLTRATELVITGDELGKLPNRPLLIRVESEPHRIGGEGNITIVQPITIKVTGDQKKPLIIAYDGPALNRTYRDVPLVDRDDTWWAYYYNRRYKDNGRNSQIFEGGYGNIKMTSIRTSPPIILDLSAGYSFRGIIYAPRSKVIILGSEGRVIGGILSQGILHDDREGRLHRSYVTDVPIVTTDRKTDKISDVTTSSTRFNYIVTHYTEELDYAYDELLGSLDLDFIQWAALKD